MLINMISSSFKKYPEIQYEAAWILSNIISGSSEEEMRKILQENCNDMNEENIVTNFFQLFKNDNLELFEIVI